MVLERELETFRNKLPELLQQGSKGKYVLIHGDIVSGVWDSWQEAARMGYEQFGIDPFLVKEITDEEKYLYVPRNVVPCQ